MLAAADRSRLAHRVLRLREAGFTGGIDEIRDLATRTPAPENGQIGGGGHPLGGLARSLVQAEHADEVDRLLAIDDVEELREQWRAAADETLQEQPAEEIRAVETANAKASQAAADTPKSAEERAELDEED